MISPRDYIFQELNNLVLEHCSILCKYEYHSLSDSHFVEIHPRFLFENSFPLRESMAEIMDTFYSYFPNENLVFIAEGDIVSIQEPEVELYGTNYQRSWKCWFNEDLPANNNSFIDEEANLSFAA